MYAAGSRRDIDTLVSPILSETVAIPLARRRIDRHAWVEREVRLSIVKDAEVGEGLQQGYLYVGTLLFDPTIPTFSGPETGHPITRLRFLNRRRKDCFCPKIAPGVDTSDFRFLRDIYAPGYRLPLIFQQLINRLVGHVMANLRTRLLVVARRGVHWIGSLLSASKNQPLIICIY